MTEKVVAFQKFCLHEAETAFLIFRQPFAFTRLSHDVLQLQLRLPELIFFFFQDFVKIQQTFFILFDEVIFFLDKFFDCTGLLRAVLPLLFELPELTFFFFQQFFEIQQTFFILFDEVIFFLGKFFAVLQLFHHQLGLIGLFP